MEQDKGIASKHAEQLYGGFESERTQPEKVLFLVLKLVTKLSITSTKVFA
jgi:hypothetical protein